MKNEDTETLTPDTPAAEAEVTTAADTAAAAAEAPAPEATPPANGAPQVDVQVAVAQAKAQEYLEGWQRERAEFTNYKKRAERDIRDSRQKGVLDTLIQFLPIIDDFERAMANLPFELTEHSWLNGVSLIQKKFQKLLDDNEIALIDPVGQPFDPSRHEAIGVDDVSEVESGHVTVTLQKGYIAGDRVLRPALVRVAG